MFKSILAKKNYASISSDLIQGAINGIMSALFAVVLAFVIFNQYPEQLVTGMARILISTLVSCIVIGYFSKEKIVFAETSTTTALIMAPLATMLLSNPLLVGKDTFGYYIFIINLTCLVTGSILYILYKYNLSTIIKYLPHTAITAFLAVILIQTFLMILSLCEINVDEFSFNLFFLNLKIPLYTLIPSFILGGYLFYLETKQKKSYVHLTILMLILCVFMLGCAFFDVSHNELKNSYKMLFPYEITNNNKQFLGIANFFMGNASFESNLIYIFGEYNTNIIISFLPQIILIAITSTFFTLLDIATVEVDLNKDLDMKAEISGVAKSCLASPLFGGGVVGGYIVEDMHVAIQSKNNSKILCIVGFCIPNIIAIFYPQAYLLIPKFIILAILFRILLSMSWFVVIIPIINSEFKDKIITLSGILLMLQYDMILGMALTVLLILIKFSVEYMRCKTVRAKFSAKSIQSTTSRDLISNIILEKHGTNTLVWLLQGYVFFGNSHALKMQLLDTVESKITSNSPIKSVILDFKFVQGTDSHLIFNLQSIYQMLDRRNITLCISNSKIRGKLLNMPNLYFFNYLDECLSWNENNILALCNKETISGTEYLHRIFSNQEDLEILKNFYEIIYLSNNNTLYTEKAFISNLYFLVEGEIHLASLRDIDNNGALLYQHIKCGNFVGEGELFLDSIAKSTAITKSKCVIFMFTIKNLAELEKIYPHLANTLYRYLLSHCFYTLHRSKLLANEILGFSN